ncbi:hypothetical protein INT47_010406, partial [Mucor saturninus]
HNIDVGTLNRFGYEHKGHYDSWINQHIEKLRLSLHIPANRPNSLPVPNALDFCSSKEVFGICPISDDEMATLCMEKSNTLPLISSELDISSSSLISDTVLLQLPSTKRVPNNRFEYIARKQQAKFAIVPVHSNEEKALFENILSCNYESSTEPDWSHFASHWNTSADGVSIFYKTPEHLKSYYNICKENNFIANSIQKHRNIIQKVKSVISETMPPQILPQATAILQPSNNIITSPNRLLVPTENQSLFINILSNGPISQQTIAPRQPILSNSCNTTPNPY